MDLPKRRVSEIEHEFVAKTTGPLPDAVCEIIIVMRTIIILINIISRFTIILNKNNYHLSSMHCLDLKIPYLVEGVDQLSFLPFLTFLLLVLLLVLVLVLLLFPLLYVYIYIYIYIYINIYIYIIIIIIIINFYYLNPTK